jgi:hypothetical protein
MVARGSHSGWSADEEADEFDHSLLGPTGTFILFHASGHQISRFKPFSHFGTEEAALQRANDKGLGSSGFLYEASLTVSKSLWIRDSGTGVHTTAGIMEHLESLLRLNFEEVSEASRSSSKAARLLGRYGYDGLVYRNGHEDRGSLSWVALRPQNLTILNVTQICQFGSGQQLDQKVP